MPIQERRERERAERRRLIIASARALAENEGWEAVTTRRLAERIEYSQPVLYSHFAGKEAIVAAVALDGFGELAVALNRAREAAATTPREAVAALVRAYADFARGHPALFDAMFTDTVDLAFGRPETPAPLQDAFNAFRDVISAFAEGRDPDLLTETAWSAVHGLVVLTRGGRLPAERHEQRMAVLVEQLTSVPAKP